MKAVLRDKAALQGLRPLEVVAYLRSGGWHEAKHEAGSYTVVIDGGNGCPLHFRSSGLGSKRSIWLGAPS